VRLSGATLGLLRRDRDIVTTTEELCGDADVRRPAPAASLAIL
jgi:hypothetical protein